MSSSEIYIGKKALRGVKGSTDPFIKGVKNINATSGSMNKVSGHHAKFLSPMLLGPVLEKEIFGEGDLEAINLENYWQYSKIFKELNHLDRKDGLTNSWFNFRDKGFKKEKADRHPVGTKSKEVKYVDAKGRNWYRYYSACSSYHLGARMDYLTSRKNIYIKAYSYLVKNTEAFKALKKEVDAGMKFMILDHDVLPNNNNKGYLITIDFLRERVNDVKVPFGHGYVLAGLLAGIEPEDYI